MPRLSLKKQSFTLVELMIVVAIIAILSGMVLPSLLRARHNTNEVLAAKGLRAISDALEMFQNDEGDYPDAIPSDITIPLPAYLTDATMFGATTVSRQPYNGYYFDYVKISPHKYTYIATPARSGRTGTKSFIVDEGGRVREYEPPGSDDDSAGL